MIFASNKLPTKHINTNDRQVNQQQISTFLTAANVKFMLLHGGKSEDSIKSFFTDVYELYVKVNNCKRWLLCHSCATMPTKSFIGRFSLSIL
jgi:hypothetical protein